MTRLTALLLLMATATHLYSQNRPGFFYRNPDFNYTKGTKSSPHINGRVLITNYLTDNYNGGGPFLYAGDKQCITVIDSSLNHIDTTIYFQTDTSSKYYFKINHHVVKDDTTYFLFNVCLKDSNGNAEPEPVNLLFFKMDPAYNFSTARMLFSEDTLGVLYSDGYYDMKYNERLGLFDLVIMQRDSITLHHDILLTRFNRNGKLQYFKKWNYNVYTAFEAFVTDFYDMGDGRYLLTQDVTNDIFVVADTAKPEIDTSYYKPEIRELHSIVEKNNSYVLFGLGDGYDILSSQEGKLQYVFLELDKNNLQEISRYRYRVPDTANYAVFAYVSRNSLELLDNGDYLFTTAENLRIKPNLLDHYGVSSIYRVDSTGDLRWAYRIMDTTETERTGMPFLNRIPGTEDRFLWHNAYYNNTGSLAPGSTWVMKFGADGDIFGIGLNEAEKLPSFSLYPNPVKEQCLLLLPFVPSEEVKVHIYSTTGKLVQKQTFSQRDNLLKCSVRLPAGQYMVEVKSGKYESTQKMLVK